VTDWRLLLDEASGWWREHEDHPRLLVVLSSDLQVGRRSDLKRRMDLLRTVDLVYSGGKPGAEAALARAMGVYAQETRRVGQAITRLIEGLPESSRRPRWVVVASTNGLSLFEKRGFRLYAHPAISDAVVMERTTHVPLLLCPPGSTCVEARSPELEIEDPVELLDLFPTFARLAHAMSPAGLPGRDLLSTPSGAAWTEDPARDPALPMAWAEFGDTFVLRQGRFLLQFRGWVHNTCSVDPAVTRSLQDERVLRHPRRYTLFDVVDDPFQERDLRLLHLDTFEAMRATMLDMRLGPAAPPALDEDQKKVFGLTRSEGYW
jgi:arylsulfatase A-like enzyme